VQRGVAGLITVVEHDTLRRERSLKALRVLLVDAVDQPSLRVSRSRKLELVQKNVVEIDVPAVTAMEHRDRPAVVDTSATTYMALPHDHPEPT